MSDSGIKIEVHLIQNFAPSNLNRDDTGQPKSATFGYCRRARISSQSGKRAVRMWWKERGTISVGNRTKRLQEKLFLELGRDKSFLDNDQNDEFLKEGIRVFTDTYYAASDKKEAEQTTVLIFIGPDEIAECAKVIKELWKNPQSGTKTEDTNSENNKGKKKSAPKKTEQAGIAAIVLKRREHDEKIGKTSETGENGDISEKDNEEDEAEGSASKKKDDKEIKLKATDEVTNRIKNAQISADIALFGRMLAEQPGRNTDGSCQVAHPISTHKVDMEMDFFTAVDDLNPKEETGSAMMGVVGFNSACYYRYALVDRDQLARNIARKTNRKNGSWEQDLDANDYEEADKVAKAFLEAMVYAIPTGKQNSFAAQNLPSFGLFVRRQGGVPISLANAFSKPVRPTKDDDDLIGLSIAALTRHWDELKKAYGDQGIVSTSCFHIGQKDRLNSLASSDEGSVDNAIKMALEVNKKP